MSDNLTRRSGIAYNLELSPYNTTYVYSNGQKVTYTFSSQLYLNIFNEKLITNRDKINGSISSRFKINYVNDMLCDIKLYNTTEKRGFLITDGRESYKCLSSIKLDGNHLMKKN